ncbi:MAG: TRAP transporter substrate-binding protein [Candidatus Adiutrix sp.]|jgi:tripartite ATP-independent transporter DctP family solute receptor|nr:TRAP transporter substrate-binding protein [Candidatus Adiutrix sp.]
MKIRSLLLSALTLCFAAALAASPALAQKTIQVKMAHAGPEQSLMHKSFLVIKDKLEKDSGGVFKADIFPNAQFGNEPELLQAIQEGDIQFMATNNGYLVNFQPANAVFSAPFAFPSEEVAYEVLDGPFGQKMLDAMLPGCGMKAVGYFESVDFRQLTANKEVRTPADLKGIKIRVMPNPIHIAIWQALGASPSALPYGELYTALQQKTVDAQENPVELILQSKFTEVQKYLILTNHVFSTGMAVANPEFYDSLTPELQKVLIDAVTAGSDYWRDEATKNRENYYKEMEAQGMTIIRLTPEEAQAFREQVRPAVDLIAEQVGQPLVDEMYQAIADVVAKKK